jgi:signal transduction histidine kinase/DNA-binding response OmpR family regulator/streptogramin lyase
MKKNVRYLVFAALFIILPVEIFCQKILNPEYSPPDVRWDNFLIKGGEVSQESICILIDSRGFLWSGSETGLYRFDGTRYREYGISNGDNRGFKGYMVTNILEDSEENIWVGTSEALNKLDQKTDTFLHYFPDSANKSSTCNFIRAIEEDRDGTLWVLTKKNIFSFDKKLEKFEHFAVDSLSWDSSGKTYVPEDQCFAEDSLGYKWFVTYRGLYLYKPSDKSFSMVLPDPRNNKWKNIIRVRCVTTGKDGKILIGTEGEGLLTWNYSLNKLEKIGTQTAEKSPDSFNAVSTILADRNGSVWSFGNGTFSNFNPKDKTLRNYIINYRYRTVYEAPGSEIFADQAFQYDDGTIWFLNKFAGLMFRFNPLNEKLSLYRVPSYIAYQSVMDNTGSFWFACIRNNIFRLVTSSFPFYTVPVTNTSHVASIHRGTILEDNRGYTYFLFLTGAFFCKNFDVSSKIDIKRFIFPDGDSTAGGGFTDSKGDLWFGSKRGNIARYDPSAGKLTYVTHNKSPGYSEIIFIPMIREDKQGNIWVAESGGLTQISKLNDKPEHIVDYCYKQGSKTDNFLYDFLIDSRDNFWILTSESLLLFRMAEKKIKDYTDYEGGTFASSYNNIRVGEDSGGNVFILNSGNGLYMFRRQNDSFERVEMRSMEQSLEYYDMLIDRNDRIWIAHNRGITVYDQSDRSSRLIKTPRLQFDVQSFQTHSGQIIILNEANLYILNENIPSNNYVPPVCLTGLRINGQDFNKKFPAEGELSSLKKIDLPFRFNTLNFEFAALNYLNPERNQYRYFMAGFDDDTIQSGPGSSAEYKQLSPGRYAFWVTGSNNDRIWNPEGVSLDIRIYPPWYRSVLAYVIYTLALLSFIAGYVRVRTYRLRREKIKLEAEIEAATAELEIKNRQLVEVDRIKTHFFTDISHEIRTPLSLILGPLEIIDREETLSTRMTGMIDLMKMNSQRLMHLVNQLLDISKLDAGKIKITLIEDDIIKCLRILVYEFLSLAESKHIKYLADLPEKPFNTWFDRDKIEKIISNLLLNAFKYTPQNGTVQCNIKIESDKINNAPPLLRIEVIDSGSGISKEHQQRIFDRFYRVEGHHEAEGYGTGIGLSLVREFVTLLHGEIKVDSTPGEGSDFSVTVPLGKNHLSQGEFVIIKTSIDNQGKTEIVTWKEKYKPGILKQTEKAEMKVLIIEDNKDLRNFLREALNNDYIILESENGKTGINMAFTMMPDLVVTDIIMPDLDGIKLCTQLKNDERTSHIPILMLTAKATSEDKIAGLQSGADDYIIKPFIMAELVTRISNLLELRNKLRLKYSKFHLLETDNETPVSVDDRFMAKVLKIINANFRDFSFDVASLQEHLGMSKTHITRKLKVLTGLSPGIIIRNVRLEKAAKLLLSKKGNITEIANSVGLSNPSNFTKSFRKYFGVSPKDYAKH